MPTEIHTEPSPATNCGIAEFVSHGAHNFVNPALVQCGRIKQIALKSSILL